MTKEQSLLYTCTLRFNNTPLVPSSMSGTSTKLFSTRTRLEEDGKERMPEGGGSCIAVPRTETQVESSNLSEFQDLVCVLNQ